MLFLPTNSSMYRGWFSLSGSPSRAGPLPLLRLLVGGFRSYGSLDGGALPDVACEHPCSEAPRLCASDLDHADLRLFGPPSTSPVAGREEHFAVVEDQRPVVP